MKKRSALTKLSDVRRELASLYHEAREKKINVADASRLANLLQILAKVIEGSDVEARLSEIERLLMERKGGSTL